MRDGRSKRWSVWATGLLIDDVPTELRELGDFPLKQHQGALDTVPVVVVIETPQGPIFFKSDFPT